MSKLLWNRLVAVVTLFVVVGLDHSGWWFVAALFAMRYED